MSGISQHNTPEEVQAYWRTFALANREMHGFMFSQRRDATSFRTTRRKLHPYLNHSRWVADCPMDECNGGLAVWKLNPQACCLDCGTIFTQIMWPPDKDIEAVEAFMLFVPFPDHRNWRPERENVAEMRERMHEVALV
jgi:hypothetical protein